MLISHAIQKALITSKKLWNINEKEKKIICDRLNTLQPLAGFVLFTNNSNNWMDH